MCLCLAAGADINYCLFFISYCSQSVKNFIWSHQDLNVNYTTLEGLTVLMKFCDVGDFESFSKLCDQPNIDLNSQDELGHTAIHYACKLISPRQTAALESRDHVKSGVSAHERPLSPIPVTSEDIHIFQSQSQSRPEIVLSFNINNDLAQRYFLSFNPGSVRPNFS